MVKLSAHFLWEMWHSIKRRTQPLLISNMQVPVPKDQSITAANDALKVLEEVLIDKADEIAALIVEPLIQGAGGMHMYHPAYLTGARALTKRHNVHFIADEIMTGFGRTGKMFAFDHTEVSPDFMTLSKGLTGGYLPLSVVMTTNDVYNAFYCDYNEHKAFLHSHSYTGNPLACAAALATFEIFEASDVLGDNVKKAAYIKEKTEAFKKFPQVKESTTAGNGHCYRT